MAPLSSHWKLFPYIPFTSTQGCRADSYQSPPQPHPQPTMEREKQNASDKERATRAKAVPVLELALKSHPNPKMVPGETDQPARVSPRGFCKCGTPSGARDGVRRWRICVIGRPDQVSIKRTRGNPWTSAWYCGGSWASQ